jgi:C_GCAxxG_C_C family probable redox protein
MPEKITKEEREEILDRVEKRAAAYNYEFAGCGQMVFLALQQEFKLPGGSMVFKAAGFTGRATSGLAGVCGALVGGIMAIGLASGREKIEDSIFPDPDVRDEISGFPKSLETIRKFYKRFSQELGSWFCRDLQIRMLGKSYDPENKEESDKYLTEGGKEKCNELVGKAARLAAETILEMPRR